MADTTTSAPEPTAPIDTAPESNLPITPAIAAANAPPPVATPSVSPDLLEQATQYGLDVSTAQSDKDIAAALFQHLPYAQYGRQALASPPVQPVAKEPEPEAEPEFDLDKHFSEAWKVPELSQGAQWALDHGAFTENEQGVIVAKPGLEQVALPYLREVQEHAHGRERLTAEFQKNPVRFIYDKIIPALRHELRTDFEQIDKETRSKSEAESFEKQFADQNKDWLFNPDGQLSPAGVKFTQQVQYWRSRGVQNYEALAQLASAASRPSAQPPAAAPPTTDTAGLARGPDGKFVSKQASFLENAKRQSAASAGGGRSPPSAEDYVPANRGELESIWTRKFGEQRAAAK